jgi:hypothetical protein
MPDQEQKKTNVRDASSRGILLWIPNLSLERAQTQTVSLRELSSAHDAGPSIDGYDAFCPAIPSIPMAFDLSSATPDASQEHCFLQSTLRSIHLGHPMIALKLLSCDAANFSLRDSFHLQCQLAVPEVFQLSSDCLPEPRSAAALFSLCSISRNNSNRRNFYSLFSRVSLFQSSSTILRQYPKPSFLLASLALDSRIRHIDNPSSLLPQQNAQDPLLSRRRYP